MIVVGANGAGKTWFAAQLANQIAAPVISKDALALTTGWQQRPRDAVRAEMMDRIAGDRWVLEGGPTILTPGVLALAQCVVWLDMPTPLRAWRILRRSVRYFGRTRPEHPPGNRDWPGRRQWRFLWRALTRGKAFSDAIETALVGVDIPVVRLRHADEVDSALRNWCGDAGAAPRIP